MAIVSKQRRKSTKTICEKTAHNISKLSSLWLSKTSLAFLDNTVRGDANARYGWFGGSSESLAAVVKHGFGRCNNGVHLSSPHSPYQSSILSKEDENGERHMVLCRVEEGSSQCLTNTHILPEYIVTFKAARNDRLLRRRPSVVAGLCFRKVLVEMGGNLPSAELRNLDVLYQKYKTGRMSKDAFISHLGAVAGDKLLASSVRKIRGS